MSKIKAASIHFLFSLLFISAFLLWVYFVWYDQIFVPLSGVLEPIKLLISIDVILGPILTFIVYKAGKKRLKMDLSFILLVQLAAFFYGAYTLYVGKPSLVAMKGALFEVVVQKEIKADDFSTSFSGEFKPLLKPLYALGNPLKTNEFASIRSQLNVLDTIDLSATEIKDKSMDLSHILAVLELDQTGLENQLKRTGIDSFQYYPLIYNEKYAVLVIDEQAHPIAVIPTTDNIFNVVPLVDDSMDQ